MPHTLMPNKKMHIHMQMDIHMCTEYRVCTCEYPCQRSRARINETLVLLKAGARCLKISK